jgi:hypothetical protein
MFLIVFNTFECVPLKSELKKDEERRRKERCKMKQGDLYKGG